MPSRLLISLDALVFVLSLLSCEIIRRYAIRKALFDRPNERSLHVVPTPRLGGVAIVVWALAAGALLALRGDSDLRLLVVAGLVVAGLGLIDDVRPLPASIRFVVQIAVSAAFVWLDGDVRALHLVVMDGVAFDLPAWLAASALVIWFVATLNIYNFMDGMDGLAGLQAVTASLGQGLLLASAGAPDLAAFSGVIGASSGGFLMHNFPPARIFLGDAGSTFLGFIFAGLAVVGMHRGLSIAQMTLPLAPFLLDGTFTIFRRALRREAIWRAHRSHLYQRAVQTGLEHRAVLLVYAAWLAVSLIALASDSRAGIFAGWGAVIVALVAVCAWVMVREAKTPSAGAKSARAEKGLSEKGSSEKAGLA